MSPRDIIVIGGSAGSGAVLKQIVSALPADFSGSVFVTTHVSAIHPSLLPDLLDGASSLPVVRALDGEEIRPGRIYVAGPDRHLLLLDNHLRLGAGPRENMSRPSIDPMFRSAALSFGPRAVGVILTGMLSDGASGLSAIQRAGGVCIVQDPADAAVGEMPRAALEAVDADHVVRADQIGELLVRLAATEAGAARPVPDSLLFEVEVAAGARLGSETLRRFAEPAPITCPDCAGVLSEISGERPLRYRCQIGHAYTAEELAAQHEVVDEAVRIALRMMEERVELVVRMARDARASGRTAVAELFESRTAEYRRYADALRQAALLTLRTGPAARLRAEGSAA